jgi:O-antigen/teichoic acid export membrane protein
LIEIFQKLFPKGVSTTLFTNFGVMGFQLLSGIFLARLLGPSGRGELALCIIWPTVIATLGSLGISDAIIYFTAKRKSNEAIVFHMLFMAALQSVVLMPLGFFVLSLLLTSHEPEAIANIRLFLLIIPLNLVGQYCIALAQGELKLGRFNTMRFIIPFINFCVASLLFFLEIPSVRLILIGQLAGNLFVAVIYLYISVQGGSIRWGLSPPFLKDLIKYGIRSHLGTVTQNLNQRLDQMLISLFLPTGMLGYYVVAVTASNAVGVIPNAFRIVLFPSAAGAGDIESSKAIIQRFFVRSIFLVSLCCLVLWVVFPHLLPFIYGREFQPSVFPGRILLLAVVFASMRDILAYSHRALNNPLVAAKSEVYGLITTGISLLILLPALGIVGAAFASAIAYATSAFYNIYMMKKLYAVEPFSLFIPDRCKKSILKKNDIES